MRQKTIALLSALGLLLVLTGCQTGADAGQEMPQAQTDATSDQAGLPETAGEPDSAESADVSETTDAVETPDPEKTSDTAETAAPADSAEQSQAETAEPSPEADTAPLLELLAQIRENVRVGTAGSSLSAAAQAASLLDWSAETALTAEQIQAAVQEWYAALAADEQAEALEQLDAVAAAIGEVTGENGADLLETAGCADSGFPWNDQAISAAQAAMTAASDSTN